MLQLIIALSLIMTSFYGLESLAQPTPAGDSRTAMSGPRKQLATIVFAGLAGAVLGLSTLSFYGRPQDRLSNIAVGFAVGIIVGTTYTTYQAATQPKSLYGYEFEPDVDLISRASPPPQWQTPQVGYTWTF